MVELMAICAAGDAHGALEKMYSNVLAFEASLGICFDLLLHVGDFGIWPDPLRLDKATQKHGGAGDFPNWRAEARRVPRPTIFIKGNHEDFEWLSKLKGEDPLPSLSYLPNGEVRAIGDGFMVGGHSPRATKKTLKWRSPS